MNHFIFVVDGEVAGEFPVPKIVSPTGETFAAIEKLIAILSSDPKIVVSDEPVQEGWTWDGASFSPPAE